MGNPAIPHIWLLCMPESPGPGKKSDLEAQLGRISVFAATKKLRVVASIGEIGSGLNGHRPKLMKLLANPSIKTIVVEH